jgi:mannosyltransferase OCH1-like enzyme
MSIPAKLTSFYHSETLPPKMKQNFDDWILKNPDLEIKMYNIETAKRFIKNEFDENTYKAYMILKPYSYKSDLFRFCYMYKCGGIYVDIKYKQIGDFTFNQLLDKEHLVKEPIGIQSCLIVLKPHNEYMLQCIKTVVSNTLQLNYGYTPILTGPLPMSNHYLEFYRNTHINDLEWSVEDHFQTIKSNNKIIIQQYPEYRQDLSNSNQPHYVTLYWNRDIYNLDFND